MQVFEVATSRCSTPNLTELSAAALAKKYGYAEPRMQKRQPVRAGVF